MTMPEPLAAPADETPPGASQAHKGLRSLVEWVAIVVAALLVALLVKTFLFQPFYIPSESMDPTLKVNDRLLINKLSYKLHDVNRGDIVVFERPPNNFGASAIPDLIKRVIGLPGDTVEGRNGRVVVNGKPLKEPYLPKGTLTGNFGPVTVEKGHYWVMGDNRAASSDSRVFGTIEEDLIEGRAFFRFWPLTSLDLL